MNPHYTNGCVDTKLQIIPKNHLLCSAVYRSALNLHFSIASRVEKFSSIKEVDYKKTPGFRTPLQKWQACGLHNRTSVTNGL